VQEWVGGISVRGQSGVLGGLFRRISFPFSILSSLADDFSGGLRQIFFEVCFFCNSQRPPVPFETLAPPQVNG
jgi:hypothetical protein